MGLAKEKSEAQKKKASPKKRTTRKRLPAKPKFRTIEGAEEIKIPTNLPRVSQGRSLAKKSKIRISKYVCDIYALDRHPLDGILLHFGLSPRTFYNWVSNFSEIAQLYKESQENKDKVYFHNLRTRARTSLEKKVLGEVIVLKSRKFRTPTNKEGKEIEDIEMMVETIEKEVYVPPSDTAIIYALNNQDGGNFQRNPIPEAPEEKDVNIPPINWID